VFSGDTGDPSQLSQPDQRQIRSQEQADDSAVDRPTFDDPTVGILGEFDVLDLAQCGVDQGPSEYSSTEDQIESDESLHIEPTKGVGDHSGCGCTAIGLAWRLVVALDG
jgi:hypothetical protein